jgi:hypothetical protein
MLWIMAVDRLPENVEVRESGGAILPDPEDDVSDAQRVSR